MRCRTSLVSGPRSSAIGSLEVIFQVVEPFCRQCLLQGLDRGDHLPRKKTRIIRRTGYRPLRLGVGGTPKRSKNTDWDRFLIGLL